MRLEDLHDKIVFWDIDGTLTEFRFGDRVWVNDYWGVSMPLKVADSGIFLKRKPIRSIQRLIDASSARQHNILGRVAYITEQEQKECWLAEYYPVMQKKLWVMGFEKQKWEVLKAYMLANNINPEDVVYIDDVLDELAYAEIHCGVRCYHISSLIDWEEN